MPKQSSVILSSRQLHLGIIEFCCPAGTLAGSHHPICCMVYTIIDQCAQRHLLLTLVAQGRAALITGYRCVVMFVSGVECRRNHQSPL